MSDKKLKADLVKLAYKNPELRKDLMPLITGAGNKDTFKCPECDSKVLENTGYCMKCKKKVKKAKAKKSKIDKHANFRELVKIAYHNPERRAEIMPYLKKAAKTFKCPECGTKVLEQTGFCVKCKKKVKKKANLKRESKLRLKESPDGYSFSIGGPMDAEGKEWKILDAFGDPDMRLEASSYDQLRKEIEKAMDFQFPEKNWRQITTLLDGGNTAKVSIRPMQIEVYN